MRRLEDFMNRLTDWDAGWWPVVFLRPPKDRDIDNAVLLRISPIFGSVPGLLLFCLVAVRRDVAFSIAGMLVCLLLGVVVFFAVYKVTFAYFWNCRARRLRSTQTPPAPPLTRG